MNITTQLLSVGQWGGGDMPGFILKAALAVFWVCSVILLLVLLAAPNAFGHTSDGKADAFEGLYIGGQVGYRCVNGGFSRSAYNATVGGAPIFFAARSEGRSSNSGLVGAHAGYN